MVGGLSVMGSSVMDSHTSPCLCLDALPSSSLGHNREGDMVSQMNSSFRKQFFLTSSFVDAGHVFRLLVKTKGLRKPQKNRRFVVVDEVAGQYEESFEDVKTISSWGRVFIKSAKVQILTCYVLLQQILNYFTYKAVRTVLNQLYEMNPTQYRWFYDFVVSNKLGGDAKRFIRILNKEKQDLAGRVMITRLHLYGKWVKKCDHAEIYKKISEQNLELMRERLMETVIWPSDDTNTEMIG